VTCHAQQLDMDALQGLDEIDSNLAAQLRRMMQKRAAGGEQQQHDESWQPSANSTGSRWMHTWVPCQSSDPEVCDPLVAELVVREPRVTAELCTPDIRHKGKWDGVSPNSGYMPEALSGCSNPSTSIQTSSGNACAGTMQGGSWQVHTSGEGPDDYVSENNVRGDADELSGSVGMCADAVEERKSACARAVWLLDQRLYTAKGLAEKLRGKNFSEGAVDFAVSAAQVLHSLLLVVHQLCVVHELT
jgi:hypothetical protein